MLFSIRAGASPVFPLSDRFLEVRYVVADSSTYANARDSFISWNVRGIGQRPELALADCQRFRCFRWPQKYRRKAVWYCR
jgi:hypothetical protein